VVGKIHPRPTAKTGHGIGSESQQDKQKQTYLKTTWQTPKVLKLRHVALENEQHGREVGGNKVIQKESISKALI
jgi:hypothetical protein